MILFNPWNLNKKKKKKEKKKEKDKLRDTKRHHRTHTGGRQHPRPAVSPTIFLCPLLLRNRRGYQRDTAPKPVDAIRTMTMMTNLQNIRVDLSLIVILFYSADTAVKETPEYFYKSSYQHLHFCYNFSGSHLILTTD